MDTYDRIEKLMIEHGEKASDLAKATGMSTGLLSQWKSRLQKPSTTKLSKVAAHYNVTTDYLLTGEEKTPTPEGERKTDTLSPAFFRLKKGLEPYNISESDADFLLKVYKAHIEKNNQE